MTTRRKILAIVDLACAGTFFPALAQKPRIRRIAFISPIRTRNDYLDAFREGMTQLHWVEGRDYALEIRDAGGDPQALKRIAAEEISKKPDLLLTPGGSVSAAVLAQLTRSIPIVFCHSADPIGLGVAKSLRQPGGNATGLTTQSPQLAAKRVQLLKEAFPRVTRIGALYPTDAPLQRKEIEEASNTLGLRVELFPLQQPADIESAFTRGGKVGIQAYVVASGFFVTSHGRAIAEEAMRRRVPTIFSQFEQVEQGGLMSYSISYLDNYRRAAAYVDKILKGARPGDLPIEQPSKFELVVNRKTAKAIGLTIPQSVLLRADRVIE